MARDQKTLTYRVRRLPPDINEAGLVQILEANLTAEDCALRICVFSLARSLVAPEATRSKDATVSFNPLPQQLKDRAQWSFSTACDGAERSIIVDRDFLDFTVLNEVDDDEHTLDCVAISGLASHPFGSWQQRGGGQSFMWLRDALPKDIPGIRTITYGYDTHLSDSKSFKSIHDIAITLVNRLTAVGFGWHSSKPTVFVAHSLGGIILKEALVILAPSSGYDPSILGNIRGLLFFGVPNEGMETAQLITMVKGDPTEDLVTDLSPKSKYLSHVDSYFNGLQYKRKFPVVSFYETGTTRAVQRSLDGKWSRSGPEVIMVDKASATQKCSRDPQEVHPIDRDHSEMVKFAMGDVSYTCVVDCFREIRRGTASDFTSTVTREMTTVGSIHEGTGIEGRYGRSAAPAGDASNARTSKRWSSKDILESLWLDVFDRRLDDICPQFQSTFEWVFNDESLALVPWLLRGHGAFWIEGKPGAGKSTLMKFVYQNQRTKELLEQWSRSETFILASFFFHHRGSSAQKSFEGLLRSILHQIILQAPEVCQYIPVSCLPGPDKLHSSWGLPNLRQALFSIQEQQQKRLSMCLFIDALDEFDGHLELISDFINTFIHQDPESLVRCKIFFSSRPREIIQDCFGQYKHFKIQKHTRKDIRKYTEGRLAKSPGILAILTSAEQATEQTTYLVEDILRKAAGVFLWVKLALDDMIRAFDGKEASSVEDLGKIINRLPQELNDFYRSIVDRIPMDFRWEAYLALDVILRTEHEMILADIYSIIQWSPFKTASECYEYGRRQLELVDGSVFSSKLRDECGGLLEIHGPGGRIQLMHETVRTFLSRPGFRQLILGTEALFRPQNGYSELAKFCFTKVRQLIVLGPQKGPKRIEYCEKLLENCPHYCFMAETVSGTCQYELIEYLPSLGLSDFLDTGETWRTDCDSGADFGVFTNLLLYTKRKLQSSGETSAVEETMLLALCKAVTDYRSDPRQPIGHRWNYTSMCQLVLGSRINAHAEYQGRASFEYMCWESSVSSSEIYIDDIGELVESILHTLLGEGQNPDSKIVLGEHRIGFREIVRGRFGLLRSQRFTRPLHVLGPSLMRILLQYNADVNSRDSKGRTPLDISLSRIVDTAIRCPYKYYVSSLKGKIRSEKAAIDLLIEAGGLISQTGLVHLPICIFLWDAFGYGTETLQAVFQASKSKRSLSSLDLLIDRLRNVSVTRRISRIRKNLFDQEGNLRDPSKRLGLISRL